MNRSRIASQGVLAAILACAACQPADTTEQDVAAINEARTMEVQGASSGDPDQWVAAYTDDIVFMPPNETMITGKAALQTWFANATEQFDISVNYAASDVQVAGDWAVERFAGTVTFRPKVGADAIVENIKGIHIYQRQADGTWKIAQDVWNADAPLPAM